MDFSKLYRRNIDTQSYYYSKINMMFSTHNHF